MTYGLLGKNLSHSYSPAIHKMFGDYSYELFEKSDNELESFIYECKNKGGDSRNDSKAYSIDGLNVTIPYKKTIIPFIDELSEEAAATGSVNTVVRRCSSELSSSEHSVSKLVGYNTDTYGFEKTLDYFDIDVSGKKVLILGDGGAAASARYVLKTHGATIVTVTRKLTRDESGEDCYCNYENISLHYDADIIVNTTPVGMYSNNGESVLASDNKKPGTALESFKNLECVIDLIYNPALTRLLLDAELLGVKAINGLYMLIAQAAKSFELFTGGKISDEQIECAYKSIDFNSKNIILIGMPGVGKTTVGKELAEESGREFFDADEIFKETFALTPATVIETLGEDEMRKMETEILKILGAKSGAIIATGGGCVTRPENYDLLHQNGIIVCLDSPIKSLEISGRPLSNTSDLMKLFDDRKDAYESWADIKLTFGKDEISYESISDKWSKH